LKNQPSEIFFSGRIIAVAAEVMALLMMALAFPQSLNISPSPYIRNL
jgi:hypothetical protein